MSSALDQSTIRKPVIHHVHELQKRLTRSILAVLAGAGIAYSMNEWLMAAIQSPLGQTLYYTSPMGGFNFLLKLCLAVGFVIALPVILYQIFAFLGPLLRSHHRLTITAYALWSFNLAYCGLIFAYFISLPSALHFLSQFGGETIQSIITVDEYFNFALAYLAGFAIMFQVPLIILFINRIKPLTPKKMFGVQRFVILFSFIGAAILTPTPDPMNQLIMALPAILLYQVGIVLVWMVNRSANKAAKRRAQFNTTKKPIPHNAVHNRPALAPDRPVVSNPTLQPQPSYIAKPVKKEVTMPLASRRSTRRFIDIAPAVKKPNHIPQIQEIATPRPPVNPQLRRQVMDMF